jgi:hypothetical protein
MDAGKFNKNFTLRATYKLDRTAQEVVVDLSSNKSYLGVCVSVEVAVGVIV